MDKASNTGNKLGLSEQTKFDPKTPLRGTTGENNGQRPVSQPSSVKTSKGSFKVK
jgi:hypothetical protein